MGSKYFSSMCGMWLYQTTSVVWWRIIFCNWENNSIEKKWNREKLKLKRYSSRHMYRRIYKYNLCITQTKVSVDDASPHLAFIYEMNFCQHIKVFSVRKMKMYDNLEMFVLTIPFQQFLVDINSPISFFWWLQLR